MFCDFLYRNILQDTPSVELVFKDMDQCTKWIMYLKTVGIVAEVCENWYR